MNIMAYADRNPPRLEPRIKNIINIPRNTQKKKPRIDEKNRGSGKDLPSEASARVMSRSNAVTRLDNLPT